ncbi:MAG: hypothetical protein AABX37_02145 [Nanoarchaeota archaeon]
MAKRCILCSAQAEFRIKDTPDFYCQECAEDNFSDLSLLVKMEEEAQRLKETIKKLEGVDEDDNV